MRMYAFLGVIFFVGGIAISIPAGIVPHRSTELTSILNIGMLLIIIGAVLLGRAISLAKRKH